MEASSFFSNALLTRRMCQLVTCYWRSRELWRSGDVAISEVAQIAMNLPVDVVADSVNAAVAVGHVDAAGVRGAKGVLARDVSGILWCIQQWRSRSQRAECSRCGLSKVVIVVAGAPGFVVTGICARFVVR